MTTDTCQYLIFSVLPHQEHGWDAWLLQTSPCLRFWVGNIAGLLVKKLQIFEQRKALFPCLSYPAACLEYHNVNPAFPSDSTPWLSSPLSPIPPKLCDKNKVSPCTALLPVEGCFFPQLPLTRASLTLSDLAHSQKKLKFRSSKWRGEQPVMLSAAHCCSGLEAQLRSLGTNELDGCFQPETLPLPQPHLPCETPMFPTGHIAPCNVSATAARGNSARTHQPF